MQVYQNQKYSQQETPNGSIIPPHTVYTTFFLLLLQKFKIKIISFIYFYIFVLVTLIFWSHTTFSLFYSLATIPNNPFSLLPPLKISNMALFALAVLLLAFTGSSSKPFNYSTTTLYLLSSEPTKHLFFFFFKLFLAKHGVKIFFFLC